MDSHEQSKAGEGPTAPALPDYVLSPDAVFSDTEAQWRYGRPPDYSQTRRVWKEGESVLTLFSAMKQKMLAIEVRRSTVTPQRLLACQLQVTVPHAV